MARQSSSMIDWSWTDVSVLESQVFGQALMDSCDYCTSPFTELQYYIYTLELKKKFCLLWFYPEKTQISHPKNLKDKLFSSYNHPISKNIYKCHHCPKSCKETEKKTVFLVAQCRHHSSLKLGPGHLEYKFTLSSYTIVIYI